MRRKLLVVAVALPMLGLAVPSAQAGQALVVGLWPQTYAQFQEIQAASGVSLGYFRGRQRDGQFDSNLVPSDASAAAAAGYSLGLNIQPKTGSGSNRTGIRYTDITAQLQAGSGPYYDKLVSFAREVLALPTYGTVTNYLQFHSEANIQAAPGVPDAQPYSGTGNEYRQCYALVRSLFDSMGVTDHILWQVVLTRSAYEGSDGGPTNWYPADSSLYDLVGVDSYHRANTWLSPSQSFDGALAFAHAVGKPVWIDETGADEGGPSGSNTDKAGWFAAMGAYLGPHVGDIAGVVFSHAKDGGNWFLDSILSGGRASPNYTGTTWNGWTSLLTAIDTQSTPPPMRTLTVLPDGDGGGSIVADVGGVDCGQVCSATVQEGTQVVLTATAAEGSVFAGWSGSGVSCQGTGPCAVTVGIDTTVTATFRAVETLSATATGNGSVTSAPTGIACPSSCSATFPRGTDVILTATPDSNAVFQGWSGACSGAASCVVTMGGARSVGAAFAPVQHSLAVTRVGSGSGSVTSAPAGIVCGTTCTAAFDHGAQITLTATPGAGMVFTGWSGACSGVALCTALMTGDVSVTAIFEPAPIPAITLADADPSIAWSGWRGVVDPTASGGAYRVCPDRNSTMTWVSPATTSITWIAHTGPNLGRASVTIDGRTKGTVDLYRASTGSLSSVYAGLTNAAHSVVIKVLGSKSTASTGTSVTHDAFVVGSTVTEESAPGLRYASWSSGSRIEATDGTLRSSSTRDATASVAFSGRSIDWITVAGPAYGMASVTIDGVAKGTVDLYRSVTIWRSSITYGGLAQGPHTLVIRVLGSKNSAATGRDVVVDGFVVRS